MKAWKMNVRVVAPLAMMCCLAFVTQSAKAQQTFSYPDFSSTAGLTLNGTTAPASNGSTVLRLTTSAADQLGTVFYSTPVTLTAGFTTTFQFQISQPGGIAPADGIAFVVQNSSTMDHASGVLGGSIGYGDDDANSDPADAISNSVAVELDTYQNSWDVNANHIAVMSCGTGHNSQHHDTKCQDGTLAFPTLAINTSLPITLSDGAKHTVTITYTPPCANCQNLTVTVDGNLTPVLALAFDITSIGLGANGTAYVGFTASTGGGFEDQDIVNWNFSSQTITKPVSTTGPTSFDFNANNGQELVHAVNFVPVSGTGPTYPLNDPNTLNIQSTNISVDITTWPQYVTGGPLAPSTLFPMVADNISGPGTNGGLFVDLCYDPTMVGAAATPSDANCPFYPNGSTNFLGINVVADLVSKPSIAPGTTSVLAHYEPNTTGTTTWSPSPINGAANPACVVTLGSPSATQPASPTDCDVLDIQQSIGGDQTTSSGRSRGKGTFAFAYNVPMLLSTVSVNGTQLNNPPANSNGASASLWFSAASAPLGLTFLVNPACPPGSATCPALPTAANNYFSAAPVAGESFDVTSLTGTSVVGTTAATAPSNFTTAAVGPVTFTGTLTGVQLPDGQYILQWSALDNVGILEQNQQRVPAVVGQTQCPDGSPVSLGGFCYTTTLFSAQLNVDSTPPTITPTFTPPSTGNIFAVGSTVIVNFGCADNLSGIATCQSTGVAGLTNGGALNTASSQVGTHTFTITATDKAGNAAKPQTVSYQIVASSELLLLNLAKPTVNLGSNLTYNIGVLNLGPAVADNVVVTDTLPAGTTFVSAGYGTVSCSLSGCSDLSGPGSACMQSGNTVTCNIPTVGLLLKSFTGALVKITVNVNTATSGTVLTDTATGKAVNTDPIPGDNSATARTEVCSSTGSCPKLH